MMRAVFDEFLIALTAAHVAEIVASGERYRDVVRIAREPYLASQLAAIPPDALRDELRKWGLWGEAELCDEDRNRWRIVWIAAGSLAEGGDRHEA